MTDCIFCKIAAKEIPAKVVAETDLSIAFWDISPKQPVHILVIPRAHHENVVELSINSPDQFLDLARLAAEISERFTSGSFRLTFNTGAEAGQTVFHAHAHVTSTTPKEQVV